LRGDRAPIGTDPVGWKERHVEGLAPFRWLRGLPRWLGIATVLTLTVAAAGGILYANRRSGLSGGDMLGMALRLEFFDLAGAIRGAEPDFFLLGVIAAFLFSLIVGIRCSASISGERERQTWEALLLTPLTVEELVRGKLWGIMLVSQVYLAAYAVPAVLLSLLGGPVAVFWTVLWLGVTVLAMYYLGAAGLWSSAGSKGSWRSLLSTIGWGYLGGFVIYLVLSPVIAIVAGVIYVILAIIDVRYGTTLAPNSPGGIANFRDAFLIATCLGLVILFWLVARLFLRSAQNWIANRERTRHWQEEPAQPRRKRRRRIAWER
jgi:ABC-type transport system involved in multi-copper enzyme maturation permease subunit